MHKSIPTLTKYILSWCFLLWIIITRDKNFIYTINIELTQNIQHLLSNQSFILFAEKISMLFQPEHILILSQAVALIHAYRKEMKMAKLWCLISLIAFFTVFSLKYTFNTIRPCALIIPYTCAKESLHAFPSGHIAMIWIFFKTIQLDSILNKKWITGIKWTLIWLLIASRVVLKAHWMIDIFGAILISQTIWMIFDEFHHIWSEHSERTKNIIV